jgi:hypothetical protein
MLLLLGFMKNDSTTCMFLCTISDKVTKPLSPWNHVCVVANNVCAMCCSLKACGGLLKGNRAVSLAQKDITRARGGA